MESIDGTVILILFLILIVFITAIVFVGMILYGIYNLHTNPDKDETQEEEKRI